MYTHGWIPRSWWPLVPMISIRAHFSIPLRLWLASFFLVHSTSSFPMPRNVHTHLVHSLTHIIFRVSIKIIDFTEDNPNEGKSVFFTPSSSLKNRVNPFSLEAQSRDMSILGAVCRDTCMLAWKRASFMAPLWEREQYNKWCPLALSLSIWLSIQFRSHKVAFWLASSSTFVVLVQISQV